MIVDVESDEAEKVRLLAVPIEQRLFDIVQANEHGNISLTVRRGVLLRIHEAIHCWLNDGETDSD